MKVIRLISSVALAIGILGSSTIASAHGPGSGSTDDGFIVTRHFTGIWDQVDQEAQGLALQVVEQLDNSRKSAVYWYTYGADRKTAWFIGIGDLVDNRIEYELFESADVGFLQDAMPGNDSVQSIGTMTIVFDSCDSGVVTYETAHDEVGSGSFNIERLLEVMNTHCSGGISDDMYVDGMFGEQRLELPPAREGVTGSGVAQYGDYPGHMDFEVDVEGLPDGDYHLYVGMQDRGGFTVQNGHGEMGFASPQEDGKMMMTFDPRGQQIEIHNNEGVMLSSFDDRFEEDDHGHHGDGDGDGDGHGGHDGDDDHNYDCEFDSGSGGGMGGGMGSGMTDCFDDGEFIEIEVDLENTGVLTEAKGEAEWEMNSNRVEFSVEIEDVPVGFYTLKVGGVEVGIIEAFEMHMGGVYGHIMFRDPESYGREHLDFEPRGQKIEVLQQNNTILEVNFPAE
jgi:hypothetical protein